MRRRTQPARRARCAALPIPLLSAVGLAAVSCAAPGGPGAEPPAPGVRRPIDVAIADAPYESVDVDWKHRLGEGYVFVEHAGLASEIGARVNELLRAADTQGFDLGGDLFVLYELASGAGGSGLVRARVCLAVEEARDARAPLGYAELPDGTVAYGVARGPYGGLAPAYDAVLEFVEARGWTPAGPLREIYLNPGHPDHGELLTEIQLPWAPAG